MLNYILFPDTSDDQMSKYTLSMIFGDQIHINIFSHFFYDQISTHIFFISLLSLSDVKLNLFFSNFSQTYVKLHLISWFFLDKMINHIFCLIFQDYMLFHTLFLCQLLTRSVIQLLLDFPHNQNLFFNYW